MVSQYNDLKTFRKPDIILASKQDVLKSQDRQRLNPVRAPHKPFDWHIVRAAEENKFEDPIDNLPLEYSIGLSHHIPAADNVTTTPSTKAYIYEADSEGEDNIEGNEETEEEGEGEEVYSENEESDEETGGQGAVGNPAHIPEGMSLLNIEPLIVDLRNSANRQQEGLAGLRVFALKEDKTRRTRRCPQDVLHNPANHPKCTLCCRDAKPRSICAIRI